MKRRVPRLEILLCVSALSALAARGDWTIRDQAVKADLPAGAQFVEAFAVDGPKIVKVQGVVFSQKKASLSVLDNPGGRRLGELALPPDTIAAANGGFFHPDRTPLGLVIADGKTLHPFEKAKLLAGILVVTKGRPRLVRSGDYTASRHDTEALQAGPVLVEDGRPTVGLNAERTAWRTVVVTDGRDRWAVLNMDFVTLADAGRILATPDLLPGLNVDFALNLDGGSSCGLWVATGNPPFYFREHGNVRNFLLIRSRR